MSYFHLLPEICVKVRKREPKRKTITGRLARGAPKAKFNHWQMIQDRIAGMSWFDIGVKHGVTACSRELGDSTKRLVENSHAMLKMSPDEVRRYDAVVDRRRGE